MATIEGTTADRQAKLDGTYNMETNHFACTECYEHMGRPTAPWPGWKAP